MNFTKEQRKAIEELNASIKDLDPVLKERLVDYGLFQLFKEDYVPVLSRQEKSGENSLLIAEDLPGEKASDLQKAGMTIKKYFDLKQPNNVAETVTVFAFYLEHNEKLDEFGESEIADAYFKARVRKPKVISQALRDAKNVKGYLVEGSKKGKFRLSNIGENLVLHDLPRKNQ